MNKKLLSAAIGLPLLAVGATALTASNAPAGVQPAKAASAGCCTGSGATDKTTDCCPGEGARAKTIATNVGCCDGGPCCP